MRTLPLFREDSKQDRRNLCVLNLSEFKDQMKDQSEGDLVRRCLLYKFSSYRRQNFLLILEKVLSEIEEY